MDREAYKRLEADILAMIPDLFAVADRGASRGAHGRLSLRRWKMNCAFWACMPTVIPLSRR